VFGVITYLLTIARKQLVRATRVYWVYRGTFTSVGILMFPLGLLVALVQNVLTTNPPIQWVVEFIGRSDEARLLATLLVGGLLSVLEAILIGPAVVSVIGMIRQGRPTDAWRAYGRAWRRLGDLFRGWLRVDLRVLLRGMTIVGLPFAVRDAVRWSLFSQAMMLDETQTWQGARATSAAAVTGKWWRTAGKALLFTVIGLIPGPVIGITLLLTLGPSIEFLNVLSSLIYAIVIPFKYIGLTLMYLDWTGRVDEVMANVGREEAAQARDRARRLAESPAGSMAMGSDG
jgi:hypothetical protein